MGIRLSDILAAKRTITVGTDVGDIELKYFPNAVTPQLQAQLNATRETNDSTTMLQVMANVFCDWDVVGPLVNPETGEIVVPDGEKIPLTAEFLNFLPTTITGAMFSAAADDMLPKSKSTSKNSSTPTSGSFS
jgi:hypothetical protein